MINENQIIANELNGENNWEQISKSGNLTEEQLIQYKNKLDWYWVLTNQINISNKLLDILIEEEILDLNDTITKGRISEKHANELWFIEKYKDQLNIKAILRRNNFKISIVKDLVKKPEIGMGGTIVFGSDCYSYTVIEINKSSTRIKVQQDFAKPDKEKGYNYYSNQVYTFSPNSNGPIYQMSLRKDGTWKEVNGTSKVLLGYRNHYQDPHF